MKKAFTLIEILITLIIIVISLYFLSSIKFHLPDTIVLKNELDQVKNFFYQIQSHARYNKQNYEVFISQNSAKSKWCILAVKKESSSKINCDCLNIISCNVKDYYIYNNQFENILLTNKSLYPKVLLNIDGLSGKLSQRCINFALGSEKEILQFDPYGIIYVIPKNKRSTCKD